MALPLWKPNFLSLNLDASRSDPELVTLDGVTIAKTRFLVTKLGSILMARTDGRTHIDFWSPLHNKSFGQRQYQYRYNYAMIFYHSGQIEIRQ